MCANEHEYPYLAILVRKLGQLNFEGQTFNIQLDWISECFEEEDFGDFLTFLLK